MTNELDESTGPINKDGNDINVINKQLPVKVGFGSTLFEIALWTVGTIPGIIMLAEHSLPTLRAVGLITVGVLPGLIFLFIKVKARAHLRQLQQKIQAAASEIDNYLEQRAIILANVAALLEKSIDLDKDVMKTVAAYRSGATKSDAQRNETTQQLDGMFSRINLAFEAYPELKAQAVIADAMRQNSYLQKEITAARTLYNDTIAMWNQDIFSWPAKQIVAARSGYTTRIPFIASEQVKAAARKQVF